MSVLVVQHLVTLPEATRIIRFFKRKKHACHGYFFDLQELGVVMKDALKMTSFTPYGQKTSELAMKRYLRENAYLLRVYREVPGS
jgi:hypothetical protein